MTLKATECIVDMYQWRSQKFFRGGWAEILLSKNFFVFCSSKFKYFPPCGI